MNIVQFIDLSITLLVISNPLILVEAFLGVMAKEKLAQEKQTAIFASIVGGGILIVMTWVGTQLLAILGIKMEAFQIAGGIIVIILGFSMLNPKKSSIESRSEDHQASSSKSSAIIPLAFPLIAGPGAISTVIVKAATFTGIPNLLLISLACILLAIISGVFMYFSGYLAKKLGPAGINIFGRVGGLILLTLGIQILMGGLGYYFPKHPSSL